MNAHNMKYLKENEAKVYNCTFELELYELRIFLRFPCKFFVEWKTTSGNKQTKTQGFAENVDGKVLFNQKLTLEAEMLYDTAKNAWIRKDSIINVYLVTKSKPDFNQLAGRINIDLSAVCQSNPYKKPLIQSLTYSSTSADLRFSMNMKYSLQSNKSAAQLDLLEFNDRLYLVKQNDSMNKCKSLDYLKNTQHLVSPVYLVGQSPSTSESKENEIKPFQFPMSKLESFGHEVNQVLNIENSLHEEYPLNEQIFKDQPINLDQPKQSEFNPRMTLGNDKKNISREDYESMIQQQSQGMKKSNLMIIPDIKKSRVEEEDSEFNTEHSKKTQEDHQTATNQISDLINRTPLKKMSSEKKFQKNSQKREKSPESVIDIVIDLSECGQSKEIINGQDNKNLKTSMNSSKSFSISRFKAQFEGSSGQGFNRMKSPKQSMTSLEMPSLAKNATTLNSDQEPSVFMQKYEAGINRIKELQTDVSQLVNLLTDSREKNQKLEENKRSLQKKFQALYFQNCQLQKHADQLEQKANYESKINSINCEKLKTVSSQLTMEKSRTSKSNPNLPDLSQFNRQITILKQKLHKANFEKASLQEKIFKRDQIQLQNQIRIQELQQELTRYRTQKLNSAPKVSPLALQIQSKINTPSSIPSQQQQKQQQYINFLQENIQKLQHENMEIKEICNQLYKNLEVYLERDQRMRQNIAIVQQEFQNAVRLLIQKEGMLKEIKDESEGWKKKSYIAAYNASAIQELKHKSTEEELKRKDQIVKFCEGQIHLLSQEITQLQAQNKELSQIHNKIFRESFRYEGDLKVIKEEESFRESLASSAQAFRLSFSASKLNLKEENAVSWYREAVQAFFVRNGIEDQFEIEFTAEVHDLRKKAFIELERSAKIINELLMKNEILKLEAQQIVSQKERQNRSLQQRIIGLQTKIDDLQEQEKISAGSSNITPFSGSNFHKVQSQQKVQELSQATRKRSPLNLNSQTKLTREVQKLKSIIYDKNKEMSDLIASYEKLKLEKQTQSMLIKSKKVQIQWPNKRGQEDESDAELVHDILDLQIRLNKEKEHKHQIMEELSLQKSHNKSQQISQYVQFDISEIYKEIRSLLTSRQNFITTQQSLHRLICKINHLQETTQRSEDKDYRLMYLVEEKSRSISKELQIMKSALFKMNFKDVQPYQYKTMFANVIKPCQAALTGLLTAVEEMVNTCQ